MTRQPNILSLVLLYSFDNGNESGKGLSSERPKVFGCESCLAPMTPRRGIQVADEQPTYSLRVGNQVLVAGIEDTHLHGKRSAIRRHNGPERYSSDDYFYLTDIMFLHAFPAYLDCHAYIAPTGVLSVPVRVYNNEGLLDAIRGRLVGQHEIEDYAGHRLLLDISLTWSLVF